MKSITAMDFYSLIEEENTTSTENCNVSKQLPLISTGEAYLMLKFLVSDNSIYAGALLIHLTINPSLLRYLQQSKTIKIQQHPISWLKTGGIFQLLRVLTLKMS